MNSNTMDYKGYIGSISVSIEDGCLHGRILFINDLITYESDTVVGMRAEFNRAVDDYIATCKELGVSPDKPCSGTFNVRIGADLHREAVVTARKKKQKLNEFVKDAIIVAVSGSDDVKKVEHVHTHILDKSFSSRALTVVASAHGKFTEVRPYETRH